MWHEDYSVFVDDLLLPTARGLDYLVPGFLAETGEVAGKIAKSVRDEWEPEKTKEEIEGELGDVLFFLQALCNHYNISLAHIAQVNMLKLASRRERGKLQGSGDNR